MRVMHVVEAMHQGGAESLVLEHVRHAAPGVETLVCALNRGGPALEAARALGARCLVLEKRRSPAGGWAALRRLATLMRAERVTVVNGHNPTGGLFAATAARLAGIPAVRTEHSLHYPGRHSVFYPAIEPIATRLVRRVLCVCEAVRASHVRRMPRLAGRFVMVANGISEAPAVRPRAALRAELGLAADARVALAVGSLTPQKAQHVLLEAFARAARDLPAAVLLIAGEGRLRADLEARRDALGLGDRVRFLGARPDVPDLMEAADVFALTSVREGLSVTLLEAMRAGRAVVASRVGGNGEAVADGVTGLLAAPGDVAALAAGLAGLLGDPARAVAFGLAGRRRWAGHFTAERMVRETEEIYAAVARETRRASARTEELAGGVHDPA
ncbi:MAG: glycosyltransferase [Candidatus Eisenbacteria bacterium]|nr:glycosyltransferase [Candidatus Eisenbacteria bacterium]